MITVRAWKPCEESCDELSAPNLRGSVGQEEEQEGQGVSEEAPEGGEEEEGEEGVVFSKVRVKV